jgi:hypothetical protein
MLVGGREHCNSAHDSGLERNAFPQSLILEEEERHRVMIVHDP